MMTLRFGVSCAMPGLALALAFAPGCGGQVDGASKLSQFTSQVNDLTTLEFTRTSTAGAAPLHVEITTPSDVQTIYRATFSLPEMAGTATCTEGVIHYRLTFKSGSTTIVQVDEEPDGCERVSVPGVAVPLVAGDAYWAKLSEGLGVPESIMYPETAEAR